MPSHKILLLVCTAFFFPCLTAIWFSEDESDLWTTWEHILKECNHHVLQTYTNKITLGY